MHIASELTAEERQLVLLDWEAGKAWLVHTLQTKLSFWRSLPYLLAIGAHWDDQTARQGLKEALAQYDAACAVSGSSAKPHRLSHLFCSKDGQLRRQVERFADGSASLMQLPELEYHLARLQFLDLSERSIERVHKQGKMSTLLAPHSGESYYSLQLRLPSLERDLERGGGEFMLQLGQCLERTRKGLREILLQLGSSASSLT